MSDVERDHHDDDQIKEMLFLRNVAVVGISRNEAKAARFVPEYLSRHGFNIIPVNPNADRIMGEKCHPGIEDVDDPVDIVDVFRPSDQVIQVVRDAIAKGPKVIWLQEGIHNPEAEELARSNGIEVVFNRCMLAEHRRLFR